RASLRLNRIKPLHDAVLESMWRFQQSVYSRSLIKSFENTTNEIEINNAVIVIVFRIISPRHLFQNNHTDISSYTNKAFGNRYIKTYRASSRTGPNTHLPTQAYPP
ncbi:MAG: hypothetical protein K6U03_09905, partial [Firmicutes bacterium]|nr:hypothetical protein [Bacillota bacterium]